MQRGASVELAPHQERGHRDPRQEIALIRLGHHKELNLEVPRADRRGNLLQECGELGWRLTGEEAGERWVELLIRCGEHLSQARQPRFDLCRRKRALPAGIRAGEDERAGQLRPLPVDLLDDGTAPREAGEMRRAELQ